MPNAKGGLTTAANSPILGTASNSLVEELLPELPNPSATHQKDWALAGRLLQP